MLVRTITVVGETRLIVVLGFAKIVALREGSRRPREVRYVLKRDSKGDIRDQASRDVEVRDL